MKSYDTILKTLINIYDEVASRQTNEGKTLHVNDSFTIFGQCTGLYYAALFKCDHKDNPYYQNADLLEKSIKSWDYYISLMNEKGQAPLITFDQFWEYFYDEWGILHLINTTELLKDNLPEAKLSAYKEKIDTAITGILGDIKNDYENPEFIQKVKNHEVANHFLWRITCVYRYAMLKQDEKLMKYCLDIIHFVCENQLPFGTWLEGNSLVVKYSHTTLGALGQLLAYTGNEDKILYNAVVKNMEYLLKCYYKKTEVIGCFDCRNQDEVFFEFTFLCPSTLTDEAGLKYNSKHILSKYEDPTELYIKHQSLGYYVDAFLAMNDNVELTEEEISSGDEVVYIDKLDEPIPSYSDNTLNTLKICKDDFVIPVCILKNFSFNQRWIMQRQNIFAVYHKKSNIIIGGGNSIASPEFSPFNIISNGKIHYLHDKARFISDNKIELIYDDVICTIEIKILNNSEVIIKYSVTTMKELDKCFVNIPIFLQYIKNISTRNKTIEVKSLEYNSEFLEENEQIATDYAEISLDKVSTLTYPVYLFNPYMQIQKESFEKACVLQRCQLDNLTNKVSLHIKIK